MTTPVEPLAAAPSAERREAGGYVLLRRLGRGGMGDVWLGRHRVSGGTAAVKLLDPDAGPRVRAHFAHEVAALSRLSHPHIVNLYDAGPDYIVTPWIDGFDLHRRLRSPLPPAELLRITRTIAAALAHAHERAVVHRDVKPSNILLDRRDQPFLADFGLAQLLDVADDPMRGSGTPHYMAPEQRAGAAGPASDQYALGRTLLTALVGPEERDCSIARLPPDLPPRLVAAITRATDPDPARRFPSMTELAAELTEVPAAWAPSLAPLRRACAPFAWCARPTATSSSGAGLMRADHRIGELERAGALPPGSGREFLEAHGYAELSWSMYGASGRLGRLDDVNALARADVIVVLMHGLFTSRAMWEPLALRLVRDMSTAIVIAPDLHGFGESPFRADVPPDEQLAPLGALRTVRDLLRLLGFGDVPTVLMASCYAASALLAVGDDELGGHVTRVALTPSLPAFNAAYRRSLRLASTVLMPSLGGLAPVRRAVPRRLCASRTGRALNRTAAQALGDAAAAMPGRRLLRMMRALLQTPAVAAHDLERCVAVTTPDDPVAATDVLEAALLAAGFSASRLFRLVGGGHYPLLDGVDTPGWCARNADELVGIVDAALDLLGTRQTTRATEAIAPPATPWPALGGARTPSR